jgi:excisionase family DNA binding protein
MPDRMMTIREVADYLRVSRTRLYQLARAGELPAKRVGHLWRFSKTEVDGWLSTTCKSASAVAEGETEVVLQ